MIVMRGLQFQPPATPREITDALLSASNPSLYAQFATQPLSVYVSPHSFRNISTYALACSNSQAILNPLETLVLAAQRMRSVGAHLNHYEKYDIDVSHVDDCLESAFQIITNYKFLSNG